MDWVDIRSLAVSYIKKYRFVLLVFIVGLLLMLFPENSMENKPVDTPVQAPLELSLEDSLADILSQMEGAGKTRVLLTQAVGEKVLFQADEDISSSDSANDIRTETVILTDGSRGESGLIQQIIPPVYQGAIILCQGADSPTVRLSIVEAVANATGLTTNNITVLKMK